MIHEGEGGGLVYEDRSKGKHLRARIGIEV